MGGQRLNRRGTGRSPKQSREEGEGEAGKRKGLGHFDLLPFNFFPANRQKPRSTEGKKLVKNRNNTRGGKVEEIQPPLSLFVSLQRSNLGRVLQTVGQITISIKTTFCAQAEKNEGETGSFLTLPWT